MRFIITLSALIFFGNFGYSQFTFSQSMNIDSSKMIQKVQFIADHIDLGTIERGAVIDTSFTFFNFGSYPLRIELVSGCECTTLDWTRSVIQPREQGIINVHFDSSEKEKSETVDVDIYFAEVEESNQEPLFEICSFSFVLKE